MISLRVPGPLFKTPEGCPVYSLHSSLATFPKTTPPLFSVHCYKKVSTDLLACILPSLVLVPIRLPLFQHHAGACREPGRGSSAGLKTSCCGGQGLNSKSIFQVHSNSCGCGALQYDLNQGTGTAVPGQGSRAGISPLCAAPGAGWTQSGQFSVKYHLYSERCYPNQSFDHCRNGMSSESHE